MTPECTLVTLFSDLTDVLQMPSMFTVDLYKPKMGVTATDIGYLMAHDDDALHYREKSLMQGLLNRDDLPRIRSLVEKTARRFSTTPAAPSRSSTITAAWFRPIWCRNISGWTAWAAKT